MGTLTPGATYIYERSNGVVYARESGKTERHVVGYEYQRDPLDHRNYMSNPQEAQLWHDIRRAAEGDKELQDALERVKVLYYLKHQTQEPIEHHPV